MEKLVVKDITVEKAIQKGLIKLNTTRENIDITVVDEGKKGLFGFGQRDAVIEIFIKEKEKNIISEEIIVSHEPIVVTDHIETQLNGNSFEEKIEKNNEVAVNENNVFYNKVVTYLENVSKEYGASDVKIVVKATSKKVIFQIETLKAGLLIGKHGKIINALQVLAQTLVYRNNEKAPMVVVNIGDYRQKREEKLKEMADKTAKRVLKTNQAIFLEELPAFERKIIHARLSEYENIQTHSEGKDPHRYLVVDVK